MDSFRGFEDEAAMHAAYEDEPTPERPPEIGVDERRMHVRAYNYWVSLLADRPFPSIQDLDPHSIEDFGPHSVLLDFSKDPSDPEIAYLGRALRAECDLDLSVMSISRVPSRSLLSRLTDHYLQIIANRAPIGFEAEFVSQRGHNTLYRGILMPLSSNGDTIDFIYGVINWKEMADSLTADAIAGEIHRAVASAPKAAECPVWADGPSAAPEENPEPVPADEDAVTLGLWEEDGANDAEPAIAELPADAGLADLLCIARQYAEQALEGEQRSRASLYRALGQAWDFALAAEADPGSYAELLEDSGLKAQARAPMTPIAKLVFGAGYDKTRLTEFAAALCWARRQGISGGALADRLASHPGGVKGVVAEERRARRPESRPDRWEAVRDELYSRAPLAEVEIDAEGSGDFVLLLARRSAGRLAIVAPVTDEALVERAIRRTA